MIISDQSTASERRKRVRSLAHVSAGSTPDIELDDIIDSSDEIAKALFGGLPTEAGRLEMCITVSNLKSAMRIRMGYGDNKDQGILDHQKALCEEILAAANQRADKQHAATVYAGRPSSRGLFTKSADYGHSRFGDFSS